MATQLRTEGEILWRPNYVQRERNNGDPITHREREIMATKLRTEGEILWGPNYVQRERNNGEPITHRGRDIMATQLRAEGDTLWPPSYAHRERYYLQDRRFVLNFKGNLKSFLLLSVSLSGPGKYF